MYTDREIFINVFDEKSNDVVKIELGEVVKRITTSELPDNFNIEAAKALAVAIRTGVVKKLRKFEGIGCENHKGADICTGMKGCTHIVDVDSLKNSIGENFEIRYTLAMRAAEDTSGKIITYGARPISVDYHLVCGGGTENSEDVIGNTVMYLRKVLCKYCLNSPYWEKYKNVQLNELENILKVKLTSDESIYGPVIEGIIEDADRDETGRVKKVKIGGRVFTGKEIKELLGLSSSRFGWDAVSIRFKTRGEGNGLGMCLYGANKMAEDGFLYDGILKYYYTNTDIENIDIPGEGTPLRAKTFIIDPGHGGENGDDEKGLNGLREKDVNLYIAKKLGQCLEKSGAKVILTRYDDENISLPERIKMVNEIRPNFLISIHQNSFFAPGVCGTEVYYYRGDIEGEKLSSLILDNIVKALGTLSRGYKTADFYTLRESKVSSVVVECMYISNPEEEQRLMDDNIKLEIGKSIYRGIMDYYGI